MKIKVSKKITSKTGVLAIALFKEDTTKLPAHLPKSIKTFIKEVVKEKDFTGERGEILSTYFYDKELPKKIILAGLGNKKEFKNGHGRRVGGSIGKGSKKAKASSIQVVVTDGLKGVIGEFVEGIMMSLYDVGKIKKKREEKKIEVKSITIIYTEADKKFKDACVRAQLIAEASEFVRDLVNFPSNVVNAEYMEKSAKAIARENKYKIKVLKEKELKKEGWGGLLAVNQGSTDEARAIIMEYSGGKKGEKPVVMVGKGVIFDTGGYNLKPSGHMETMQQDMGGAATVLGVMSLLKKLGIKRNVVGILPIAENMVSDKAYKPSDIITMLSGHTVEITNTDAEGRLILADGLAYGAKMNPESLISISTLTGAVAVALGDRYAGLIGNNDGLSEDLQKAGDETDDRGWILPLINDYRKKMESKVADLRNYDVGTGRYAGTIKAAAFLEKFVDDNNFCQIDIGGTAFSDDPLEYQEKGATAHGLRMLTRFLEN